MPKGVQIALGAAVIALLLGWYAATNLEGGTFQYYQTLSEFRSGASVGQRARVHGYVIPGTIDRDVEGKKVRFSVQEHAPHGGAAPLAPLRVVYQSLEVPDLFKDGAEVVVEGRLDAGGKQEVFVAENVLAKCPSKFEAKRSVEASF